MFEVGFTEIILILGLALLVLGPEKLPALAEKIGRWTGRARSMARQLRSQLEQEVTLDQLAKSRPMQAAKESPPEPSPPGGIDLDKHFDEIDTTPEGMHGKGYDGSTTTPDNSAGAQERSLEAMHANLDEGSATTPEAMHAPSIDEIDTSPEAMHGQPKDKATG
jgi:sec-independent protein translocase protein TatB